MDNARYTSSFDEKDLEKKPKNLEMEMKKKPRKYFFLYGHVSRIKKKQKKTPD